MTQSIPKITRLDKPATPDFFGIANSPIGFVLLGWQGEWLVRITILPADAEKQPEFLIEDHEWDADIKRDDARAKTFVETVLFPNHHWTGKFPPHTSLGFYGTDFQWAIIRAMNAIKPGKTLSYAGLAKTAGQDDASRAAGTVCAKNPLPLIVPCHRVIKSDGSLGNYGYGLGLKRQLLHWEIGTGF